MATVCECCRSDLLADTAGRLKGFGVVTFSEKTNNEKIPLATAAAMVLAPPTTIVKNPGDTNNGDSDNGHGHGHGQGKNCNEDSNEVSEDYNLNQITAISSKINLSNSLTSNESILRMQIEANNGRSSNGNNKHKTTMSEKEIEASAGGAELYQLGSLERRQQQSQQQQQQQQQSHSDKIKPTSKRYFILFMFVILQIIKSFQWIFMASVTNVVAKFYDVDNLAINWTALLFMVTFLILALPVSWIMDSLGLRRSLLIGSIGVTIGVCIKCFSSHRDGFALHMFGQLIIGLAEPFFFSSYSQVASIWFPDHQVALATAASLIGEQTGLALGFIIPPLMIGSDPSDYETIQEGLSRLLLFVACISVANTGCIVLFFDDKPQFAPGIARYKQIQQTQNRRQSRQQLTTTTYNTVALVNAATTPATTANGHRSSSAGAAGATTGSNALMERRRRFSRRVSQSLSEQMKLSTKFITSKHFILLLIGFGINVGIACSIHTLLNQMIIRPSGPAAESGLQVLLGVTDEPDPTVANKSLPNIQTTTIVEQDSSTTAPVADLLPRWDAEDANLIVGNAGLILIMSGLIGSGLCGFVLDRYHNYKLTIASAYLMTLISMAALTVCLLLENELVLYLVCIPLGFALTGYASCGFDYGVEITYPKPELLSSTLLNISAQIFGVPISLIGSVIVDNYGSQALGAFFCAILLLGFIITLLQGGQLRRQDAVREGEMQQQRFKQQAEHLRRLQQRQHQTVWSI